jgi:hypothetical protein
MLAAVLSILLDHLRVDFCQRAVPEGRTQVLEKQVVVALTAGKRGNVRTEKLFTQLIEGHPLASPADLEQPHRNFALALLPYLYGEVLASGFRRLELLFTVHRVAHPPEP